MEKLAWQDLAGAARVTPDETIRNVKATVGRQLRNLHSQSKHADYSVTPRQLAVWLLATLQGEKLEAIGAGTSEDDMAEAASQFRKRHRAT